MHVGMCEHAQRPCTRVLGQASHQYPNHRGCDLSALFYWGNREATCHFNSSDTAIQKCQQHQCSPDTSQPCTKCACYQKTSSVGKFLSSYILTSPVLNPSSSQSTPVVSASSPPLYLPCTKASLAGEPWAQPAEQSRARLRAGPDSAHMLDVIRQPEAAETSTAAPWESCNTN